jgi:hypothetical protein
LTYDALGRGLTVVFDLQLNRFDSRKLDPLQDEQIQDHEAALNLHETLLEKGTPVLCRNGFLVTITFPLFN